MPALFTIGDLHGMHNTSSTAVQAAVPMQL